MQQIAGDRWFYHPSRDIYTPREEIDQPLEDVHFASDRFTLHGWFMPATLETIPQPKGTVLHCHGNGGNVTGHFKFVSWLPTVGWNVLTFDYRGFGRSEGKPSREGTIHDAAAASRYLARRDDVDPQRLVVFGQSLGGAVAIVTAARHGGFAGLVAEGAFAHYQREADFVCRQSWWLWGVAPFTRLLVGDGYDPIDHVTKLGVIPKFFIGAKDDNICDPQHTVELYDRADRPKELWMIEGGRHLGALGDTDGEGPRRVEAFFSRCVGVRPGRPR